MGPERLAEIEARLLIATPTIAPPCRVARYDHGGGRMFVDGAAGERRLIADFYHESDREFYAHAYSGVQELVTALRLAQTSAAAQRSAADVLLGYLDQWASHVRACAIEDGCRDCEALFNPCPHGSQGVDQ